MKEAYWTINKLRTKNTSLVIEHMTMEEYSERAAKGRYYLRKVEWHIDHYYAGGKKSNRLIQVFKNGEDKPIQIWGINILEGWEQTLEWIAEEDKVGKARISFAQIDNSPYLFPSPEKL